MFEDAFNRVTQLLSLSSLFSNLTQTQWRMPQMSEEEFTARCLSFPAIVSGIPELIVHTAEFVASGTNLSFPDGDPSCLQHQVVSKDICRVTMAAATSNTSEISLEAWFPFDYTGRVMTVGNRGLAGCILHNQLEISASQGFASVGANNGHNGSESSGTAFLNSPEVITDYAYRSVHTSAVIGKQLAAQFYKVPFRKSYFMGCSSGGRQAYKSAQDFPDDFDGILAGCPAIALSEILVWGGRLFNLTGPPGSDTFVPAELWGVIHDEVLRQCDELDGARDGLLEDPDLCRFNPETLICAPGQKKRCLTGKQAATVQHLFGPFYGANGELIYPRMQPGINTKDEIPFYFAGSMFALTEEWFRNVIYNTTSWSPTKLNTSYTLEDVHTALAQNPANIRTFAGDLGAFAKRGGKLLAYHGLQDNVVSSEISQQYYGHVARTMELPPVQLDKFYRLFRVSGLAHCMGGDGASAFGQDVGAVPSREESNALADLVRWVEEERAPEVLRGAKLAPGKKDGKVEVEWWRNHCRWPLRNRYVGPGDWKDEDAWKCV